MGLGSEVSVHLFDHGHLFFHVSYLAALRRYPYSMELAFEHN